MDFLVVLFLVQLVLTIPVAWKTKSIARFLIAGLVVFFGIILPNFCFYFSSDLTPESKDGCPCGWIDCFIQGKLVLAPIAVWATAALYALEVWRMEERTHPWVVLGIFSGAILSIFCLLFCWVHFYSGAVDEMIIVATVIPFYVAAWYTIRAIQLIRAARLPAWQYLVSQLVALPFWVCSYVWSSSIYDSLPDTLGPGCFVVTAASRGHACFTGPHTEINRHGRRLRANQQLLTFWELESRWRMCAPRIHAAFRRIYNRVGPVIAARIKSPWAADLVFLGLKPLEIVARCLLWVDPVARHVSAPGDGRTPQMSALRKGLI